MFTFYPIPAARNQPQLRSRKNRFGFVQTFEEPGDRLVGGIVRQAQDAHSQDAVFRFRNYVRVRIESDRKIFFGRCPSPLAGKNPDIQLTVR